MNAAKRSQQRPTRPRLRLVRWLSPGVLSAALLAMAAGFGQFGAVAALGDVAKTFGHATSGASVTEQAGLSGTQLGLGLTVIRLASLGALPLAGLADRFGRRPTLLTNCAIGLVLTVAAATSPAYWWFVVLFAVGRPFLSATTGIAQVVAAELTATSDRAKAIALIAAGYSAGAGITAVVHSLASATLGFRGTFGLALVPLVLLPLIGRHLVEPDRFAIASAKAAHALPVLGAVAPAFRRRLAIVAALAFAISVITGPANSFVFLFADNVVDLPGPATAAMVVGAGAFGLAALFAGRWLADHWGRRPTAACAMVMLAACGVLMYGAGRPGLVAGYILGITTGAIFAPAAGSLVNEVFPTSVRASVAGWQTAAGVAGAVTGLLAFGAVVDVSDRFGIAAVVTFVPPAIAAVLFWFLPETKHREPEELWPDTP